jgi:hypothetical protein
MATCSSCRGYISPGYLLTQKMICPHCGKRVRFNKVEYRAAVRPGLITAVILLCNVQLTADPVWRMVMNVILIAIWVFCSYRYYQYLKSAVMEAS